MKNILFISYFFYLTNLFAQVNTQIYEKINDFKNDHYLNEEIRGTDVTDSLGAVLDYHNVFTLISNQVSPDCPSFGVVGDRFYKVITHIDSVLPDTNNLTYKLLFTLRIDSNQVNNNDTLIVIIEKILRYNTEYMDIPVVEIIGVFGAEYTKLQGVFKIISGLDDGEKLLSKKEFSKEEGFMNAWLGSYNGNQIIAWGFDRFPSKYFNDFDVGNGELIVNYKYLENGWSSTFSLKDFITEKIEDIPVSDYIYYGVKSEQEFFNKWFQIAPDLGYSTWGYRYDQLELDCK